MAPVMTSPTSAISNRRGAFTLLELLIVIGIILLLAGILLPTLGTAIRAGKRAAIAGQIQSISVALEQYKQEYNDYPRVTVANTGAAVLCKALMSPGPIAEPIGTIQPFANTETYLPGDLVTDGGSAKYVCILSNPAPSVAPTDATSGSTYWKPAVPTAPTYTAGVQYPAGSVVFYTSGSISKIFVCVYGVAHGGTPAPPTPTAGIDFNEYWSEFNWSDGGDEQSYRTKRGSSIKSPYLQSGTFKVVGCAIVDRNDNPILYFPAASGSRNPAVSYADATPNAIYNPNTNLVPFSWRSPTSSTGDTNARNRLVAVLGDNMTINGMIDANETAATTGPYILWSAGPDGRYGSALQDVTADVVEAYDNRANNPTNVVRCDDVTNFR